MTTADYVMIGMFLCFLLVCWGIGPDGLFFIFCGFVILFIIYPAFPIAILLLLVLCGT